MAPHGEALNGSYSTRTNNFSKPPRLSNDSLHRTISDISFQMSKDAIDHYKEAAAIVADGDEKQLPPISEVDSAKCECCGMSEEYTAEYIEQVRKKYLGKWICGLCSEAVKEEIEKKAATNGGSCEMEEALNAHMNTCARFNKFGRSNPALLTAEAMREILRKGSSRSKSISPRDHRGPQKKTGISRSSSCIPAITREMNDLMKSQLKNSS